MAMTSAPDLVGQVVLVTGGARGIGSAIAQRAARSGALVAVGYRNSRETAERVVDAIRRDGGTAMAVGGDLARATTATTIVAEVGRALGPVDGLVNSAAVMANGDFLAIDETEWDRMLREDLLAVVGTCRAVLPGMIERGRGSIVNLTSRLAEAGAADAAPYAVAKAGVVALTRSLALAYGPQGIRVNAVSPGTTATDMGRAVIESEAGRARAAAIPIRRFVTPEEVAAAAVFLLSDAAGGFTGQTLHVNGGEWMR
jgi:NAD(P)-dependent dehydrogenase (short-subunit alcohol dehydrogenase family)